MGRFLKQQFPSGWQIDLVTDGHETNSLGRKLNDMAARSSSEFLIVWDDDDLYTPSRIAKQVQPLLDNPALLITGTSQIVYKDSQSCRVFRYSGNSSWIGALAFRRSAWESCKFEDFSAGVDTKWLLGFAPGETLDLRDDSMFLAAIHPQNTCRKHTSGKEWQELSGVPEYLK